MVTSPIITIYHRYPIKGIPVLFQSYLHPNSPSSIADLQEVADLLFPFNSFYPACLMIWDRWPYTSTRKNTTALGAKRLCPCQLMAIAWLWRNLCTQNVW